MQMGSYKYEGKGLEPSGLVIADGDHKCKLDYARISERPLLFLDNTDEDIPIILVTTGEATDAMIDPENDQCDFLLESQYHH